MPACANSHISDDLFGAYVDHVKGLSDLYDHVVKGSDPVEEFEEAVGSS